MRNASSEEVRGFGVFFEGVFTGGCQLSIASENLTASFFADVAGINCIAKAHNREAQRFVVFDSLKK